MQQHPALLLLPLALLLVPAAAATHTPCDNTPDDVYAAGIGVDTDADGNGKAVCVLGPSVIADDRLTPVPGGYVLTERILLCNVFGPFCVLVLGDTGAGAAAQTSGGSVCLNALCPRATAYLYVNGAPLP